jgi:hypothetical protein
MKGQSKGLSFSVDISDINTGSYILELMSPNGKMFVEQIIKVI